MPVYSSGLDLSDNLYTVKQHMSSPWFYYLPSGSEVFVTEFSGIYIIRENRNGNLVFSTLDRLAQLVKHKRGVVSGIGKSKKRLTKNGALTIAEELRVQAKKLEDLAATYKLIATALSISVDEIDEIVKHDKIIKKRDENPF